MLPLPGDIPLPQPIRQPHGILKKSAYLDKCVLCICYTCLLTCVKQEVVFLAFFVINKIKCCLSYLCAVN